MNLNNFNFNLMSNVWATMPCVQRSHKMFVICINDRQNQSFSEMSLRDVMELPRSDIELKGVFELETCKEYIKRIFSSIL